MGGALSALTASSPQNASQQELLSQADEILQQMSEITGMPIKGTVNKQIVSRAEVEKYLIQNLQEEMTPAELHAQEVLVRPLAWFRGTSTSRSFLISFYTEQAGGLLRPQAQDHVHCGLGSRRHPGHGALPRTHPRLAGSKLGPGELSARGARR